MSQLQPLQVRNLQFDLGAKVPRVWHRAGRAVTTFFNNLSVVFPAGERFFIASVKAHRKYIDDPVLRETVRLFCAQEGVHGREHIRYNNMLRDQGYPIAAMERGVEAILALATRVLPPRGRLAATCALEHLTAALGHLALTDPGLLREADLTMGALWRWHAAEELEHKAVAFEVYTRAGGGYVERAAIMVLASVIFFAWIAQQQLRMMHADKTLTSQKDWADLIRFLFIEPGALRRLLPLYLQYYRPDFHPRDIDSDELLAQWRVTQQQATGFTAAA
jgi:predicted metal-dependent hydrolase